MADEDDIAAPERGFRERCCERLGPKSHALEFLPRGRRNVAEDPNFHRHQFHLPASVADFVAQATRLAILLAFARVGFLDVALRWDGEFNEDDKFERFRPEDQVRAFSGDGNVGRKL